MKKLHFCLFALVIFNCFRAVTQNYTADIEAKFASKNDIDFVLVSDYNGSTSNCQYYVANDTLYEGARKVALKDIKFDPIDIYKNVFNTINGNYPYVLTLKPKTNCFTYYYGTAVNGQIELYLPGEKYALETWTWLFQKAKAVNTNTETQAVSVDEKQAKDMCFSTLTFLNEIMSGNLTSYMDELVYSNGYDEDLYYSKITFPGALKTYIIDTGMFQENYRSAEIIFMEEWPDTKIISSTMIDKYKELVSLMKLCLANNKFEYENKDADPDALYEFQSEFTKFQPADPNVMFSSLQTPRGFRVQVVITQNQKTDGSYVNVLAMNLKAQ